MKRPTGLTVIGVFTVAVTALLALGCAVSFFIAVMGLTEQLSEDPVSSAIVGMAVGGGFGQWDIQTTPVGLEWITRFDRRRYRIYPYHSLRFPEIRFQFSGPLHHGPSACPGDGRLDARVPMESRDKALFWRDERFARTTSYPLSTGE